MTGRTAPHHTDRAAPLAAPTARHLLRRWTPRGAFCVIAIVALAIRLYAAHRWNAIQPDSSARLFTSDEPDYDWLARDLLNGHGISWPGRVPLYPLWLAIIYAVSGGSYRAVPYAQIIPGVATALLTFVLARRLFGEWAAMGAALAASVSGVLVRQTLHLMSEALFTPLVLAVTITLFDAVRAPSARRFLCAGLWLGAADLVRPMLLLFPIFAFPVLLLLSDVRQALRTVALYASAVMIVILPWSVHNYVRYHDVVPLQTSNAILWQGSPEYFHLIHDRGMSYMEVWTRVLYPKHSSVPYPGTIAGDRYWTARALESIRREPLVYARFFAEKMVTYWIGDPSADWNGSHVYSYSALRGYGYTRYAALDLMIARLLPLVVLVAIALLRHRWRELIIIYALLAYCTLLHATTHAEARLSEPLQPLLLVLIAGAAMQVVRARCQRAVPSTPDTLPEVSLRVDEA